MIMTASNDMIVLFLGLETLSIALYVLASSHRRRTESQESGLKYFILGGFASAFFLYGIALIYGSTGTTNIAGIGNVLSTEVFVNGDDAMLLAGIALLIVGLAFKVAVVPFHFWTPDVYQGAPTPVTSFMASVGKFAAFAALLRVVTTA
jgi:NADH-quinone oxidoreductase subunit N